MSLIKGDICNVGLRGIGVGAGEEALVTLLTDSYLSNGQTAPIAATRQTVFRYLGMTELFSPVGGELRCSWVNKYLQVITSFGQAFRIE